MSIHILPFEVRRKIFNYVLDFKDTSLKNCIAVCKSWYHDITPIFHETFFLAGEPREFLSILSNQTEERNFSNNVKALEVIYDLKYQNINLHGQILPYFPSLHTLDVTKGYRKASFLVSITKRINDRNVQSLKKILIGTDYLDQLEYQYYFDCIYSLRYQLTFIELSSLDHEVLDSKKSIHFIKDFPNLTEISIKNLTIHAKVDPNFCMFLTLESIPRLRGFEIENDFEENDSYEKSITFEQSNTISSRSYSSLNDVKFCIPSISAFKMDYILSYFPKTMEKFSLKMTKTKPEDWIQKNNQASIRSFGTYLGTMKKVLFAIERFCVVPIGEGDVQSVFTFELLNDYWPFVLDVIGKNRKLNCHISIRVDESTFCHCVRNTDSLLIKRDDKNLYLSYILDLSQLLEQNSDRVPDSIELLLPSSGYQDKAHLDTNMIRSLEIYSDPPYIPQRYIGMTESVRIFKSIIKKYPRLDYVHFNHYCHTTERYNIKFGSKIEDLEGPNDGYTRPSHNPRFYNIESNDYKPIMTSTQENLKYALIETTWLVPFNLHVIASLLPNLIYLNINKTNMVLQSDLSALFDLQYMYNLKHFVLDIGYLKNETCREIIIRIQYLKDKFIKCYRWRMSSIFSHCKRNKFESISSEYPGKNRWFGTKKVNPVKTRVITIKCFETSKISLFFENEEVGTFCYPNFK